MNERASAENPLPFETTTPWRRRVMLLLIFLSGLVIGGVVGRIVTRQQMLGIFRNQAQIPERILPHVASRLDLSPDQTSQVNLILHRHFSTMESTRAENASQLIRAFDLMQADVEKILTSSQVERWQELCALVKHRYLPASDGH